MSIQDKIIHRTKRAGTSPALFFVLALSFVYTGCASKKTFPFVEDFPPLIADAPHTGRSKPPMAETIMTELIESEPEAEQFPLPPASPRRSTASVSIPYDTQTLKASAMTLTMALTPGDLPIEDVIMIINDTSISVSPYLWKLGTFDYTLLLDYGNNNVQLQLTDALGTTVLYQQNFYRVTPEINTTATDRETGPSLSTK